MYEEFANGYTFSYQNGKVFISNQQVAKKLPYYQSASYLLWIDPTGKFEFEANEEQAKNLMTLVSQLPIHRE